MAEVEELSFEMLFNDRSLPEEWIYRKGPIDEIEPETSPADQVRDARVVAIALISACISAIVAGLSEPGATLSSVATIAWSWAYALGLPCAEGVSVTERSEMLGIQRATLSKRMVEITTVWGLPASQFMKSEQTRQTYSTARRDSIRQRNAKLNGKRAKPFKTPPAFPCSNGTNDCVT